MPFGVIIEGLKLKTDTGNRVSLELFEFHSIPDSNTLQYHKPYNVLNTIWLLPQKDQPIQSRAFCFVYMLKKESGKQLTLTLGESVCLTLLRQRPVISDSLF